MVQYCNFCNNDRNLSFVLKIFNFFLEGREKHHSILCIYPSGKQFDATTKCFLKQSANKNLSLCKNMASSSHNSNNLTRILPRDSHLISVCTSKDICWLPIPSHIILNNLVFNGRVFTKLIIFTASSKIHFKDEGIFRATSVCL